MPAFVRGLLGRRSTRLTLQVVISLALILLLVWLARQGDFVSALRSIRSDALALAGGLYLTSVLVGSRRWQVFLRCRRIHEPWTRILSDYWLGMFCSTFLPSSVGGDAVRVYEVSRRGHSLGRVFLATFQDRLLGFGVMMALGMVAALAFLSLLPGPLMPWFFLLHLAGVSCVAALLNPQAMRACCRWIGTSHWIPGVRRLSSSAWGERIRLGLRRLLDEPALRVRDLLHLILLSLTGLLLCIGAHQVVAVSLGIDVGILAFCLIVSLVWVVKLLPVSLNGVGIGEGAFVGLLGLFGVQSDRSLALAVALLAVQTGTSLVGGLVALGRVLKSSRPQHNPRSQNEPRPQGSGFTTQEEEIRHAA